MCNDGVMSQVLAQLTRNGLVESVHHGSAVVVDESGAVVWSMGEVTIPMYPRSANKLMQGYAMVRHGLPLSNELLALACASHSGEQIHIDGVLRILKEAGLDEKSLQCPTDFPLDQKARHHAIATGLEKSRLFMNCSGKHAAMLMTCVVNDWDTSNYLNPTHPLQLACREAIEECTGTTVMHTTFDGCGAPLMSTNLVGLAQAFGRFAGPSANTQQSKIRNAIIAHPEYLSGMNRDDRDLMVGVPGLVAKIGAEAVYGIGLGDGRGLAIKIDDGADRARIVVAATILRDVMGVVAKVLDEQAQSPVFGGSDVVGQVTAVIGK
ncbi:MAG: asparaginase [Actinobacteria bacterium]|uniref:Unannotated protein n=1 Tax=freshwater metagenome TaxID=449393 RepID=A0A6J5YNV9_9ZZZZ|nr:asparaginase [Actinomycetota bacterium]